MSVDKIALRWTEERSRLGFSRAEMARMAGVSRQTMNNYENGRSPISSDVLEIADRFGLDVLYVLTGKRAAHIESVGDAESTSDTSSNVIHHNFVENVGGDANFINTQQYTTRTVAKVSPGVEHISDEQAATVQRLVGEIVSLEEKVRRRPASYRSVWGRLNKHCGVPTYRLIRATDFDKARKFLDTWMGRLNSTPTSAVEDGTKWRLRRYAYIKVNTNEDGDDKAMRDYIYRNFRASSISELANDQLERTYRYVAGRKNKRK